MLLTVNVVSTFSHFSISAMSTAMTKPCSVTTQSAAGSQSLWILFVLFLPPSLALLCCFQWQIRQIQVSRHWSVVRFVVTWSYSQPLRAWASPSVRDGQLHSLCLSYLLIYPIWEHHDVLFPKSPTGAHTYMVQIAIRRLRPFLRNILSRTLVKQTADVSSCSNP